MSAEKIEAAAAAMWKRRAKEIPEWAAMDWPTFCAEKPELAAIYHANAVVAVKAIDKLAGAA